MLQANFVGVSFPPVEMSDAILEEIVESKEMPFNQISLRKKSDHTNPVADMYAFVVLLSKDRRHALLTHNADDTTIETIIEWRLPLFVYSDGLNEDSNRLLIDIRQALGIPKGAVGVTLSVGPDYFGRAPTGAPEISGFSTLNVVYCHDDLSEDMLPSHFKWANAHLVGLLRDRIGDNVGYLDEMALVHRAFQIVYELVDEGAETKLNSLPDRRYHREWYISATNWMRQTLENMHNVDAGNIPTQHVSTSVTSTVLKQPSPQGCYYLKAAGAYSTEFVTTLAVTDLIPNSIVRLEAVNVELGCFLTKELAQPESFYQYSTMSKLLETLADVQFDSLDKIDELLARGVPDKRPSKFLSNLQQWVKDDELQEYLEDGHSTFGSNHEKLFNLGPRLITLCERLEQSPIPVTIVHGDFAPRNAGLRPRTHPDDNGGEESKEIAIFDWQFGGISHPFADMHDLFFDDDTYCTLASLSPCSEPDSIEEEIAQRKEIMIDAKSRYLAKFRARFPVDDELLRELFELGRVYGYCLRFWDMVRLLPSCKFQYKSRIAHTMRDFLDILETNVEFCSLLDPHPSPVRPNKDINSLGTPAPQA